MTNILTRGTLLTLLICSYAPAVAENKQKDSPANSKSDSVTEKAESLPRLSVSPKRCVLKSGQNECRIKLILSWESERADNLCLTEKDDDLVLACWEQAVRGATRLLFVGDETVTYVLINDNAEIVSEVVFSIGRVTKNKRKSSKRRRRFWGFL